eukprot:1107607-Prymnesium_polylepis.1
MLTGWPLRRGSSPGRLTQLQGDLAEAGPSRAGRELDDELVADDQGLQGASNQLRPRVPANVDSSEDELRFSDEDADLEGA